MREQLQLRVVVGSTRQGRQGDKVAAWCADRAAAHGAFDVEVLDLRDYPMPMFGEPVPTGLPDRTAQWNEAVAAADAYLFVTPEYNHSIPGVLKNAFDWVGGRSFRNKAAGFVAYSAGIVGGARAVEHLAHMAIEAELVPLRNSVLVARVHEAFTGGHPVDPGSDRALGVLLDDLAWWGDALREARRRGELPPAHERKAAA